MNKIADRRYRLKRRAEISRLFAQGRRVTDELATLVALPNDKRTGHCRHGVAVSKNHGNAVSRNRIKRLCREALRGIRQDLPANWDFMVVPRVGGEFTLEGLKASIRSLARRVIEQASDQSEQ